MKNTIIGFLLFSWLGIGCLFVAQAATPGVTYPATWTADQKAFMDAVLEELGRTDAGKVPGEPTIRDRVIQDINKGAIRFGPTDKGDVECSTWIALVGSNVITIPPELVTTWKSAKERADKANSILSPDDPRRIRANEEFRRLNIDWGLTFVHEYVHMDQNTPIGTKGQETEAWKHRISEENRLLDEAFTSLQNEIMRIRTKGGTPSEADRQVLQDAKNRLNDLMSVHQQYAGNEVTIAIDEKRLDKANFTTEQKLLNDQKVRLTDVMKVLDIVLTGTPDNQGNVGTSPVDLSASLPGTTEPVTTGQQGGGSGSGSAGNQQPVTTRAIKISP
jgi:hypothetical protein